MKINNSQSNLGFGNLQITKYVEAGSKVIKVYVGEIQTTRKFDKDFLDIIESSKLGGSFDLPKNLTQKIKSLVDNVITIPWESNEKAVTFIGNAAEIMDKNALSEGGYSLLVIT